LEFTFDEEQGIIIDKTTGERCLILPKARLEQIFARLIDLFQSGAQVILTEAFKAAGRWHGNELPQQARADKASFLKSAVQRFRNAGFGKIEVVEFKPESSEVRFRIWNSLFAEMVHDGSTYCNLVEAYVSGLYEQLIGVTPETQKTKCAGKNDPYCEWCFCLPSKRRTRST